jgi:hypothetical protein
MRTQIFAFGLVAAAFGPVTAVGASTIIDIDFQVTLTEFDFDQAFLDDGSTTLEYSPSGEFTPIFESLGIGEIGGTSTGEVSVKQSAGSQALSCRIGPFICDAGRNSQLFADRTGIAYSEGGEFGADIFGFQMVITRQGGAIEYSTDAIDLAASDLGEFSFSGTDALFTVSDVRGTGLAPIPAPGALPLAAAGLASLAALGGWRRMRP